MQPGLVELTEKVASTLPSSEWKKNWTPRRAWSSVSFFGSVGLSVESPLTFEEKVLVCSSTATSEPMIALFAGRSGVL